MDANTKEKTKKKADVKFVPKAKTGAKGKQNGNSAYGNVFPVATGGSSYNSATKVSPKDGSIYKGTITPEIQLIMSVIEKRGYQLETRIGKGNYAKVYKCIEKKKNKFVALKVIDLAKASDNYKLKFLPRELKVMSRVRHPNIVSIYEILKAKNAIYIFMEFAPNGTIADLIRKSGPIKENECKSMFKHILQAIHYMHSFAISHRDIKVENILLNHRMIPKITDFSYSKNEDLKSGKRDLSRTFCGSLPYLSPEILRQQSYDPLISDIWSLGISLYIMLCDAIPFKFNNLQKMLNNQLIKNWKFHDRVNAKLSSDVKSFVGHMLEPDVKRRKTTVSLLLHKWMK